MSTENQLYTYKLETIIYKKTRNLPISESEFQIVKDIINGNQSLNLKHEDFPLKQ